MHYTVKGEILSDQSPNRATVAGVDAKVAAIDAKVSGLHDLLTAQVAVATLTEQNRALVQRVGDLEQHAATQDEYAALAQRVSDLEGHRTLVLNWRAMAAISLTATLLGGFLGHLAHL